MQTGKTARILVVEDEFLVGLLLQDELVEAGYTVVGPVNTLQEAVAAAEHEQFDLAILDVNLAGQPVYPVVHELLIRNRPFIFLSGYGGRDLPEQFRSWPRVAKPHSTHALLDKVEQILQQHSPPPA